MTGVCYFLYEIYRENEKKNSLAFVLELSNNRSLFSIMKKILLIWEKDHVHMKIMKFTATLLHFCHSQPFQYRIYLQFFFISILRGTNRPSPNFFLLVIRHCRSFIHCSLCSQAWSKGRRRLWNKAIKWWWSAPLFQHTAWMHIHSAGVNHFFCRPRCFFFHIWQIIVQ